MRKPRRHFSGVEKVAILKKHLVEKVAVSALCEQHELLPTQIYNWLKEFFENGRASKAVENTKDQKIEKLEAKLQRKDSVLANCFHLRCRYFGW